MVELPRPGSSSNKTKGYYKVEDVIAAFEHYVHPQFLQSLLETIPVHHIGDGPLSVSQSGVSSEQSTVRRSVRSRSRSPRRSLPSPESAKSSAHQAPRPLPLSQVSEILPGHRTGHTPLNQLKNRYAVCTPCWIDNKTCDHKAPCSACISEGNSEGCYYPRCPGRNCGLKVKCPAFHGPGDSSVKNCLVSSLHLIALLARPSAQLHDYSFEHLTNLHVDPQSTQWLFIKIRESLKSPPPGVAVDADYISNQIIKAVGSSAINNAKKHKANVDMILDLVQEAQRSPLFELWTRDQSRNDKFGPSDS